jgi:hypothetical protein
LATILRGGICLSRDSASPLSLRSFVPRLNVGLLARRLTTPHAQIFIVFSPLTSFGPWNFHLRWRDGDCSPSRSRLSESRCNFFLALRYRALFTVLAKRAERLIVNVGDRSAKVPELLTRFAIFLRHEYRTLSLSTAAGTRYTFRHRSSLASPSSRMRAKPSSGTHPHPAIPTP